MLAIHSETTSRAYRFVVMGRPAPDRSTNSEFAGLLAGSLQIVVELPGGFRSIRKFDRSAGFLLSQSLDRHVTAELTINGANWQAHLSHSISL